MRTLREQFRLLRWGPSFHICEMRVGKIFVVVVRMIKEIIFIKWGAYYLAYWTFFFVAAEFSPLALFMFCVPNKSQ